MSLKKWDGWKKISREELIGQPSKPLSQKTIKPFSFDNVTKYSSKEILNSQPMVKNEVSIPATPTIMICENCGYNITNNDFFYFFNPQKKLICRGCRQNNKKCKNCKDVIASYLYNPDFPYCSDCKKKNVCECCQKEKLPPELNRISAVKGNYCSSCLQRSRSCLHCFRKVPTDTLVCTHCQSLKRLEKQDIINITEEVTEFYKSIDTDFFIPIRTRSVEIVTLKEKEKLPLFSNSSIVIQSTTLFVLETAQEMNIHNYVSYELTSRHLSNWKKLDDNKGFKKAIQAFLIFLYFDKRHFISLFEDINEVGKLYGKQYTLLKDRYERDGIKKTYESLKEEFHA